MSNENTEIIKTPTAAAVGSNCLLACPFCGADASIEETELLGNIRKSAGCSTEGCQGYQSTITFSTRREAISAWNLRAYRDVIEEACHAMNDAWRDILEWQQLATNTREALERAGSDPNRVQYCPNLQGIEHSEKRKQRLGRAITALSTMIYAQQANAPGEPPAREQK